MAEWGFKIKNIQSNSNNTVKNLQLPISTAVKSLHGSDAVPDKRLSTLFS
jgi:hypothetical protein